MFLPMMKKKETLNAHLEPGTKVKDIPDSWRCPVCGMPKKFLKPVSDDVFALKIAAYQGKETESSDLNHYRSIARKMLTGTCGVYSICDGQRDRICTGQKYGAPIGMGGAGQARTFETNYNSLQEYRLKMRVVKAHHEPEMSLKIFGKDISRPYNGCQSFWS